MFVFDRLSRVPQTIRYYAKRKSRNWGPEQSCSAAPRSHWRQSTVPFVCSCPAISPSPDLWIDCRFLRSLQGSPRHVRHVIRTAKHEWLINRFMGERIRQFHVQSLSAQLPEILAMAGIGARRLYRDPQFSCPPPSAIKLRDVAPQ